MDNFAVFSGVGTHGARVAVMAPVVKVVLRRDHPEDGVVATVDVRRYTKVTNLKFYESGVLAVKAFEALDIRSTDG
jgi:hypothetical protein